MDSIENITTAMDEVRRGIYNKCIVWTDRFIKVSVSGE